MKCPYCSYVSFDYLTTCRKCSKDLSAHKAKFDINFLEPISLGILSFSAAAAVDSVPSGGGSDNSFGDADFMSPGDDAEEHMTSSVEEAMGGFGGGDASAEDSFGFTLDDSTGDFNLPDEEGDANIPAHEEEPPSHSMEDEISFDSDEISLGDEEESAPDTSAMEPVSEDITFDAMEESEEEISFDEPEAAVAMEEPEAEIAFEEPEAELAMEEEAEIAMEEESAIPDMDAEENLSSSESGFSLGLGDDIGGLDSELDFSSIGSDSGESEFEDVNLSDDDIFGAASDSNDLDDLDMDLDKV